MERARFNWSLWDSGFSLQIRYRRIDSILLKAENRFVSWQTQQIFHPGYACALEPLLVLVRPKSCWELTVRMGILSQYQLLQTHAGTHRDLNTHKPQDRGKKKERKKGGNRSAAVREMTWQLTLVSFNWIYSIKNKQFCAIMVGNERDTAGRSPSLSAGSHTHTHLPWYPPPAAPGSGGHPGGVIE